jgi:hypothetical protein
MCERCSSFGRQGLAATGGRARLRDLVIYDESGSVQQYAGRSGALHVRITSMTDTACPGEFGAAAEHLVSESGPDDKRFPEETPKWRLGTRFARRLK